MFKSITLLRADLESVPSLQALTDAATQWSFVACGPTQPASIGFVAPRPVPHSSLVEVTGSHAVFCVQIEKRMLPASVVKKRCADRAAQIQADTGRKPGRHQMRSIKEEVTRELLPKAFQKQDRILVWLDRRSGFLSLETTSQAKSDAVVDLLVEACPGLRLSLVHTEQSPSACMSAWLVDRQPPAGFTVDDHCELKDSEKRSVRYTHHDLDLEEITEHITSGKQPTRVGLTWSSRLSFVLSSTLQLRSVSLPGVSSSSSDAAQDFDARLAIATAELSGLYADLVLALGGLQPLAPADAASDPTPALAGQERMAA